MSRRWSDSSAQSMAYWCIMSTQSKRVEVSDLGFRMGMSIVFSPVLDVYAPSSSALIWPELMSLRWNFGTGALTFKAWGSGLGSLNHKP